MKKIFLIIAFALTAAFADSEGIFVDVELLSGTHQRAKFLGIENDTVSLGGYIQNKFTVVRIAKKQFKKIIDEHGNDLLNGSPQTIPSSSSVASSSTTALSSATIAKTDTVEVPKQDSVTTEKKVQQPHKTVLIAYTAEGVTQSIADQFTALTARILMESGENLQIMRKSDIQNCDDNICIQSELASHGFKSIYLGEIVSNIKTDSLTLNLTHAFYEDSLPMLHRASVNVSRESAFSDAIISSEVVQE